MQERTQDVKSKTDVVGTATFMSYDTVAEVVEGIGEATLLSLINAQIRTNAMNEVRASKTGKPSKVKSFFQALALCSQEDLTSCQGDEVKIRDMVAKKQAEMEITAKAAAPVAPAPVDDDDDDGDDDD